MTSALSLPLSEETRRDLFPVCRDQIFFAHAAVATLPRPAADRMARYARESSSAQQELAETLRDIKAARATCARLIGAEADEIALLGSHVAGPEPLCEWHRLAARRRSALLPWRLSRQRVPMAGPAPARRERALSGAGRTWRDYPGTRGRSFDQPHAPGRPRLVPLLHGLSRSMSMPSAGCSTRGISSSPSTAFSRSARFHSLWSTSIS